MKLIRIFIQILIVIIPLILFWFWIVIVGDPKALDLFAGNLGAGLINWLILLNFYFIAKKFGKWFDSHLK